MTDRITQSQINFHWAKIQTLEKQYIAVENSGRQRIFKDEEELKHKLQSIRKQIDDHKIKAAAFTHESSSQSSDAPNE